MDYFTALQVADKNNVNLDEWTKINKSWKSIYTINLETLEHTKTTSHVLGARSHAWTSIESSFQSLFDFSYTCTLVPSVNRPTAFLPVISRCRRRSRCFITTAISSLMFGSMATKTKKPLNLKLPVSLRSRKHFAMKESIMQQLIVQFIGNRKITTRWNATKVSRKCITGRAGGGPLFRMV